MSNNFGRLRTIDGHLITIRASAVAAVEERRQLVSRDGETTSTVAIHVNGLPSPFLVNDTLDNVLIALGLYGND